MYFYRYFASVNLLETLKEKGICDTGTTMQSRYPNVGFPNYYPMKCSKKKESLDRKIEDKKNSY